MGNRDGLEILDCLDMDVSTEMNSSLTMEVTEKEIRDAVNQLGGGGGLGLRDQTNLRDPSINAHVNS